MGTGVHQGVSAPRRAACPHPVVGPCARAGSGSPGWTTAIGYRPGPRPG